MILLLTCSKSLNIRSIGRQGVRIVRVVAEGIGMLGTWCRVDSLAVSKTPSQAQVTSKSSTYAAEKN